MQYFESNQRLFVHLLPKKDYALKKTPIKTSFKTKYKLEKSLTVVHIDKDFTLSLKVIIEKGYKYV